MNLEEAIALVNSLRTDPVTYKSYSGDLKRRNVFLNHPQLSEIGQGAYRRVWRILESDEITPTSFVLKIELYDRGARCNQKEWKMWEYYKDTPYADIFAPIHWINIDNDEDRMIMEYVKNERAHWSEGGLPSFDVLRDIVENIHKKTPSVKVPMLCDVSGSNVGGYEFFPVIKDYGNCEISGTW